MIGKCGILFMWDATTEAGTAKQGSKGVPQ